MPRCDPASAYTPPNPSFRPTPPPASENTAGNSLDMIELADDASILRTIGEVKLGPRELAWPDAVRCLPGPPGFCLFATSAPADATARNESFVYRVSTADASIITKTPCPGICAHMHVDYQSFNAYTFSFEGPGGARAEIVEVLRGGGAPVQVADISREVAGGAVAAGQTTHCSATNHMYVGVSHGGAGKDQVLAVDLASGAVDAVTTLAVPLFSALWATCDGSGVIGGLSHSAAAGAAEFGTVDKAGAYSKKSSVALEAGLVPSGMLTATSPPSYQDAFVAAFYPPGTIANGSNTAGSLWAVDPYGGGTDDFMSKISYYLIGAAWSRGG